MQKWSLHPPKTKGENASSGSTTLVSSLDRNVDTLKSILGEADDVVFRSFLVGGELEAQLVYIPDMSDRQEIDNNVMKPLMMMTDSEPRDILSIKNRVLPIGSIEELADLSECARQLIKGYSLLLFEDCDRALLLKIAKWDKRSVAEPQTEPCCAGLAKALLNPFRPICRSCGEKSRASS